ncbi:hypothetical protein P9905_27735, partial [Serratia nevei]
HRSVRLVILVGLAIDQIAQSGLSSLSVIYYSAQLFSRFEIFATFKYVSSDRCLKTTSARTTSQATTADWGCSGKVILATVLQ